MRPKIEQGQGAKPSWADNLSSAVKKAGKSGNAVTKSVNNSAISDAINRRLGKQPLKGGGRW